MTPVGGALAAGGGAGGEGCAGGEGGAGGAGGAAAPEAGAAASSKAEKGGVSLSCAAAGACCGCKDAKELALTPDATLGTARPLHRDKAIAFLQPAGQRGVRAKLRKFKVLPARPDIEARRPLRAPGKVCRA